jgi:adenine-specific DNA-methyltransferase
VIATTATDFDVVSVGVAQYPSGRPQSPRLEHAGRLTQNSSVQLPSIRHITSSIAAGLDGAARVAMARSFARECLTQYWSEFTATTGGSGQPIARASRKHLPELTAEGVQLASRVVEAVRSLPLAMASYQLSGVYAALLPETMRSAYGVYFTPPAIVERLLDLVEEAGVAWHFARIVDPASGGGAFVAPTATRIVNQLEAAGRSSGDILDTIESRLRGIELDGFSAWMAHVFLEASVWTHCIATGRRIKPLIVATDALKIPEKWFGRADLVIGNPPYGRVTLDPELRTRYQRSVWGHANLYGVFTDLAVRLARPTGVIGFVTPASFLGGEYFKSLRRLLSTHAPPCAIDFITDRADVFDSVLQETVLVTMRRAAARPCVKVHFNRPTSLTAACDVTEAGTFSLPEDSVSPWLLPRRDRDVALVRGAALLRHRLRDYGVEVSTGPLVWNRFKPWLRDEPTRGTHPIVWAESVTATGHFRLSASRRGHRPYILVPPGRIHLVNTSSCVLLQRTTAKEQKRRLIAAVLPEETIKEHNGVVVENHLNMVRIAPPNLDSVGNISLPVVAALLNSDVFDRLFRSISGSVAVSAYEVESLPMPEPETIEALEELLAAGGSREEIEHLLEEAYGLAATQFTPA